MTLGNSSWTLIGPYFLVCFHAAEAGRKMMLYRRVGVGIGRTRVFLEADFWTAS